MRYDTTLAAFQSNLNDMANAQSKIQNGFSKMLDSNNNPNFDNSVDFTTAFVEEDFAARLAEAQLKVLKTQDDVLDTMLNIKEN